MLVNVLFLARYSDGLIANKLQRIAFEFLIIGLILKKNQDIKINFYV